MGRGGAGEGGEGLERPWHSPKGQFPVGTYIPSCNIHSFIHTFRTCRPWPVFECPGSERKQGTRCVWNPEPKEQVGLSTKKEGQRDVAGRAAVQRASNLIQRGLDHSLPGRYQNLCGCIRRIRTVKSKKRGAWEKDVLGDWIGTVDRRMRGPAERSSALSDR